jgi:hypothetical protein
LATRYLMKQTSHFLQVMFLFVFGKV